MYNGPVLRTVASCQLLSEPHGWLEAAGMLNTMVMNTIIGPRQEQSGLEQRSLQDSAGIMPMIALAITRLDLCVAVQLTD